ncbi:nucleoside-diphosphate sugar epimerase/dehydratase [Clostridium sp. HBUAS56017]|uniref:polysaccharide biosynthesis protein n=1 Tax=Clostridium sp. HBUAS56017 TaxID=2571128 RepID=UPI00163D9732|nr:nucleoside-diphosphate sugar epimerase/dehydratase [Clostridium sp. HBUAS56017]
MKIAILLFLDFLLIQMSYFLALYLRIINTNMSISKIINIYSDFLPKILFMTIIYMIIFTIFKQYKSIWTVASIEEFAIGVLSTTIGLLICLLISIGDKKRIPLLVTVMSGILIMLTCNGIRVGLRIVKRLITYLDIRKNSNLRKVLIIGAGAAGALVINECKKNPRCRKKVVAIVDDDKEKIGKYVAGVKVLGDRNSIEKIINENSIHEVIIAIARLKSLDLKEIITECNKTNAKVKIMPGVSDIIDGNFNINSIRDVNVEDLLGRELITLDNEGISKYIENKVIMVTGGGGSIGSELCRQLVKFKPKQLIIFDIYENNAYDIQNELLHANKNLNLKVLIGSIRDKRRLRSILIAYKPQVIFHAAAHKHVPLMEESPLEAIKNNVLGTLNLCELADEFSLEKFVLISTDKAVNPTNIMGASKRICEMIIQAIDEESNTEFVAVRFGNVLGSNGSVVPLFKKQIAIGGPITLTHKEVTRYFMTIPEASQLVLQAGAFAKGGEIFVLDMGEPVKIYDLAENLIRLSGFEPDKDIEIKVTGLRPGEKLYEELLMGEKNLITTEHNKIFIDNPSSISYSVLKQQINELLDTVKMGNEDLLRDKIKYLVPSFNSTKVNIKKES